MGWHGAKCRWEMSRKVPARLVVWAVLYRLVWSKHLERFELSISAWKADVLPATP